MLHAVNHGQGDVDAGRLGNARQILCVIQQGFDRAGIDVEAREAAEVCFQGVGKGSVREPVSPRNMLDMPSSTALLTRASVAALVCRVFPTCSMSSQGRRR